MNDVDNDDVSKVSLFYPNKRTKFVNTISYIGYFWRQEYEEHFLKFCK
jgi:hypothetical protein